MKERGIFFVAWRAQRGMRAVVATLGAISMIGCSTSRGVALSDVPGLALSVGGAGQRIVTTGVLDNVSSDGDACTANLVDGHASMRVDARGAVCEQVRSADGRRVRLEGIVALGCREPDIRLRPDGGGGGPFLSFEATRVIEAL